ncbi:MAG: J domain-containing protein [Pseudomonadota bacterium]
MFDRNTTVSREHRDVHVDITRSDGSTETVRVAIPKAAELSDYFNRPEMFLKTEAADGTVTFLAKSDIRAIVPRDVQTAQHLHHAGRVAEKFDPYDMLGVMRGADQMTVHAAYQAKVKAYHPDRLAGLQLPNEMVSYANAMLTRINAAYAEIRSSLRAA